MKVEDRVSSRLGLRVEPAVFKPLFSLSEPRQIREPLAETSPRARATVLYRVLALDGHPEAVAAWRDWDFSGAYFEARPPDELQWVDVLKMSGAYQEELLGDLFIPPLRGQDLRGLRLKGADLAWAYLEGTDFRNANLEGANLSHAYLGRADLRGASLSGADLEGAAFIDADLRDVSLGGARLVGSVFDVGTFEKSEWDVESIRSMLLAGAQMFAPQEFPLEVQARLWGNVGLSLYFDGRLTPVDRFLVDNVVYAVLDPDTDCQIESFDQSDGRAVIRLVASNPDDLLAVADALADRVWEQAPRQLVVNEGDVEQQFNVQGDLNTGVSEAELQAQRESLEAQLRVKDEQLRVRDEQIVVLQGKLAKAVSDLVDRIDRMVYRPGPDEEGEERILPLKLGARIRGQAKT